jgi:hypothetical protein
MEGGEPMALHCYDNQGRVWLLAYDQQLVAAGHCAAQVWCFDQAGYLLFDPVHLILGALKDKPVIHLRAGRELTVQGEAKEFNIDLSGNLTVEALQPRGIPATMALPIAIPVSDTTLVPFQVGFDRQTVEITTFIEAGDVKDVEIRLENAEGRVLHHFEGLMGSDHHNWLLPTHAYPSGTYYLTLRVGDREQVERFVF